MSNPSQVVSYSPWGTASPYLTDILGKAQGLYGQQAPLYGNPAGNFGYGQVTGALGGAINGTNSIGGISNSISPQVGSAISSELSGTPDYTAVQNALDAANSQQWNQFYNQVVPQLNQRASFLGNPSGSIKDLNSAVAQIGQNQSLNAQQAYLGQYQQALQRQANAAALGTNIAQTAGSQSLQGAALFPELSTLPQQNLADYAGIVNGTAGRYGTNSATINPGSGATAANIIGGLTAGAGLYNSLFPQNGSGAGNALLSGLGKLFGLGSSITAPGGYSSLNNFLNNGNSSAIINQYGSNGIQANQPLWDSSTDPTQLPAYSGFVDPGLGATMDTGTINWGDTSSDPGSFTSAGGQAAEPTLSNVQSQGITPAFDAYQATSPDSPSAVSSGSSGPNSGSLQSTFGAGQDALGIYQGISSGSPTGYAGAAIDAGKLANTAAGSSAAGAGLGAAGAGLGLYGGLQQGGVVGDTQAAASAAQLASMGANAAGAGGTAAGSALGTASAAAGAVAIPLAVWSLLNMTQPVKLDASWWQNMEKQLSNPSGNTYAASKAQLATMAAQGDPQAVAMAQKYGIQPLWTAEQMGYSPDQQLSLLQQGSNGSSLIGNHNAMKM